MRSSELVMADLGKAIRCQGGSVEPGAQCSVNVMKVQRPETGILYMSGFPEDVIAHRGILDSGIAFIDKSAVQHSLLSKVREMLDERRQAAIGRQDGHHDPVGHGHVVHAAGIAQHDARRKATDDRVDAGRERLHDSQPIEPGDGFQGGRIATGRLRGRHLKLHGHDVRGAESGIDGKHA